MQELHAQWGINVGDNVVLLLVEKTEIDENVQNGIQKMVVGDPDFMTRDKVYDRMKQLKAKNCEGYNRIPQKSRFFSSFSLSLCE